MTPEEQAPDSPEPLRRCSDCKEEKPLSEFYSRGGQGGKRRDPNNRCKPCNTIRQRRWRDENPEKAALLFRKAWLKRYNLTPEQYDDMLAAQGGGCAICKTRTPGGTGRFHIDHDHTCCPDKMRSCGKCIRGLLCNFCNTRLGGDNPRLLRAAAKYIEDFNRAKSAEQRLTDGVMEPLFG